MAKRGIADGSITVFGDASNGELGTFWRANKDRVKAQAKEAAPIDIKETLETADITEDDEEPAGPVKRLKDGKLYTSVSTKKETNSDGSMTGYFLTGDPETAKRHGYIQYTTDTDGRIRIDAVKMKDGYQTIRKELLTDFIAKNKGAEISWDPTDKGLISLRDELVAGNPRGADKGLSWFGEDDDPVQGMRMKALEEKIAKRLPNITPDQRVGAMHIVSGAANYLGITPDEFIKRAYTDEVFGDDPNVTVAQGKKGGVSWKDIGGMSKAIIYTTENSDFSTWAHENAHVMRRLLKDEDRKLVEETYGVEGKWTVESEERFATDAEKYLMSGEAPSPSLKNLFEKIAKWMHDIYKGMTGKVDIDPRIKSVMEKLYADKASPLSKQATASVDGQGQTQDGKTWNDADLPNDVAAINPASFVDERQKSIEELKKTIYDLAVKKNRADHVFKKWIATHWTEEDNLRGNSKTRKGKQVVTREEIDKRKEEYEQEDDILEKKGIALTGELMKLEDMAVKGADTLFQYVGEKAMLDDIERQNLSIAREMDAAGKDAETIRLATGWFKGKYDGKWRMEVSGIKWKKAGIDSKAEYLGDAISAPEIFRKYPDLKEAGFSYGGTSEGIIKNENLKGSFTPGGFFKVGHIKIDPKIDNNEALNILEHEIQHAIQSIEGFATGTTTGVGAWMRFENRPSLIKAANRTLEEWKPASYELYWGKEHTEEGDAAYKEYLDNWNTPDAKRKREILAQQGAGNKVYKLSAGEIEARDVALRASLTPEERRSLPPYSSEDISSDDAVVLFQTEEDFKNLRDRWEAKGVSLDIFASDRSDHAGLTIKMAKESRNQGLGTSAMQESVALADKHGIRLDLSPTNEWGSSKERLVKFYKRFGFVENKGRNKDYRISETMYRLPQNDGVVSETLFQSDDIRAMYEGTDKWMKAPNGKPTNLNERQWLQVRTPEFKAWFGDWINDPENASKVVDENGEPLIVYHGSPNASFTEFSLDYSEDETLAYGKGVYLTESTTAASGYARPGSSWGNDNAMGVGGVYPLFARIVNPFDLDKAITNKEAMRIIDLSGYEVSGADIDGMNEESTFDGNYLYEEIEDAENALIEFESNPDEEIDPDDYDDGYADADYQEDYDKEVERLKKKIEIKRSKLDDAIKEHDGLVNTGKRGSIMGRKLWESIWKSSTEYQDWKTERTLIGGVSNEMEFKTVANDILRIAGYDGITHTDAYNPGGGENHQVYIAFDPSSVKSAISNTGTFSNDNPSILFQPSPPTDSPAFREWFGDSAVVDAEGKPLVVYHGTRSPKVEIFHGRSSWKAAFPSEIGATWFTDDKDMSEGYGQNVVSVYLSLQNPVVVDAEGKSYIEMNWTTITRAKESGHDGAIIRNVDDTSAGRDSRPITTFVAFSPTQIKSVNNQGAWSKDDPRILFQPAYHGTPHTVDKFSTDKIGTGEGAQAYGWGLYFSSNRDVAQFYRDTLTKTADSTINGKPISALYEQLEKKADRASGKTADALYEKMAFLEDLELTLSFDESIERIDSDATKEWALSLRDKYQPAGNIYKVELPDDGDYLDWDKSQLENSNEKFIDAFGSITSSREAKRILYTHSFSLTGEEIYEDIVSAYMETDGIDRDAAKKSASMLLKSVGIPGITYMGEFSRVNEGARNYVIFDENNVQITGILFQPDSDLLDDARSFPDWQKFMDDYEEFRTFADTAVPDLPPEELAKWYKDTWERARKTPVDPVVQDAEFLDMIRAPGGVERFMDALVVSMGFDTSRGPMDEEEAQTFADAEALKSRINREANPTILNNIPRVAQEKPLTERARKAIVTLIKNGTRDYRALYADATGDPQYRVTGDQLPEIEGPRSREDMSIDERNLIALQIKDEATRNALLSGEDTIEGGAVEGFIKRTEERERDLKRQIAELEEELKDDNSIISAANRQADKALKASREAQRAFEKADREVKRLIKRGEAVSETLSSARQEAALQLKTVKKEEAELRKDIRVEKSMGKRIALDNLRTELRDAQAQKDIARKERERKVKLAKRIMQKPSDSIEYEYRQKIAAIQNLIDAHFRKTSVFWGKVDIQLDDIQKILAENAEYDLDKLLTKKVVDRITKKSLDQWTVAELEELDERVRALRTEGKAIRDAYKEYQKAQARIMRSEIRNALLASGKYKDPPPSGSESAQKRLRTPAYRAQQAFLSSINMDRVADMADGGKPGMNTELLVTRHRDVLRAEMRETNRRQAAVMKAFKELGVDLKDFYETHEIDGNTWTTAQLMGVYLADKNDQSREAVQFGNLMTAQERATLDRDELTAEAKERYDAVMEVVDALPEEIKKAADAIGKDFDSNFDRIQKTNIREFNAGVKKVLNYFPIFRQEATFDDLAETVGNELLNRNGIQLQRNAEKGFTESRIDIGPEHQKPMRLDAIDVWTTAMNAQEHFVASAEYVRELNRVYKGRGSEATRSVMEGTYGKGMVDKIDKHISEIANPQSFRVKDGTSEVLRAIRGNLGIGYLGFRVSNLLVQGVTSPAPYLGYVNPLELSAAALKVASNPLKAWKEISEKSPIMAGRSANEMMESMKEAQKSMTDGSVKAGYGKIMGATMIGLEWVDRASVMAGWLAVYDRTMAETKGDETASIAKADDITLKTQPSGYWWNNSNMFQPSGDAKGEAWKIITQFQSSLNVIWQNLAYDVPNAVKQRDIGRAVAIVTSYVIAGAAVGLLKDGYDDDDEDAVSRTRKLLYWGMSQGWASFPMVGGIIDSTAKSLITGERENPISTDLYPVFSSANKAVVAASEGSWKTAMKEFGEAIGYSTGTPVSGIKELGAALTGDPGRLIGRRK
jgi:GNAT superfamily N-acetyltransferase